MQTVSQTNSSGKRLQLIDLLRGVALIAMTLFHFGWDLEMFGFAERGFASQPAMIWFARCIASSFLFLVGVSLVLAHQNGVNGPAFAKRLFLVAGAALLITLATWFATPDIFIFFGILHHIALASVIGLLFLRLPPLVILAVAALCLTAGMYGQSRVFDSPFWWWSGLNEARPRSSDYVPIFPFFSAVLVGMAAAKLMLKSGGVDKFTSWNFSSKLGKTLRFIGRNSLVYYLLHQPVMLAILYAFHIFTR